jgi:hypothetical protein
MKERAKRNFPNDPQAYRLADHMAFCHNFCCQEHRRKFRGPKLRELRLVTGDHG